MALFCVILANSGSFRAYCVRVHVRYLISWWVLVFPVSVSHGVDVELQSLSWEAEYRCKPRVVSHYDRFQWSIYHLRAVLVRAGTATACLSQQDISNECRRWVNWTQACSRRHALHTCSAGAFSSCVVVWTWSSHMKGATTAPYCSRQSCVLRTHIGSHA